MFFGRGSGSSGPTRLSDPRVVPWRTTSRPKSLSPDATYVAGGSGLDKVVVLRMSDGKRMQRGEATAGTASMRWLGRTSGSCSSRPGTERGPSRRSSGATSAPGGADWPLPGAATATRFRSRSTTCGYAPARSAEPPRVRGLGGDGSPLDNGRVTTVPTSLTLGSLRVETPVVLAPMAGITNAAYRRLCAEQGAGLYVCEMITSRGARRARRDDAADAGLRRPRAGPIGAALRHRPRVRRQGHRDPLRRVRRGAHRPQLRLPGAQGHPQGRRGSAAVEASPARSDPGARGGRGRAVRRAGDDEDPQGPRRRPPDLPRRRPDRPGVRLRGDRPPRAHRGPGLLRRRPTGTRSRRWSTTSTSRCWATATSGRRPTRCAWSSRPVPPASWSGGAV